MAATLDLLLKARDEWSATLQIAEKHLAGVERAATQLMGVTERLGPGFEGIVQKIRGLQAANQASRDLLSLNAALRAGVITSQEFSAASLAVRDRAFLASAGIARLDSVAKTAVRGGVAELAGSIPVIGASLANLATKVNGVELAQAGVVAAGVGFISYLQNVQTEVTATTARVEALSDAIGNRLRTTTLEVQKIRLGAAGDDRGAAETGFLLEQQKAIDDAIAKVKAARAEFERINDPNSLTNLALGAADFALGFLPIPGGPGRGSGFEKARVETADAERRAKEQQAEDELNSIITVGREKLRADVQKIEEKRADDFLAARKKELDAAEEAAAKEKQLLKGLTDDAVNILKDLPGGEDLFKSFAVDQFVQKTQTEIDKLSEAITAGQDASGLYAKAVDFLKQKMQEAKDTGIVPMTQALQQQAEVLQEGSLRGFDDMGREIDSLTMDFLDSTEVMARYEAGLMSVGQTAAAVTEQIGAMAQATTQLGTAANTFFQASQTPSITGSSLAGLQGSGPGGMVTAGDILGGTVRQGPQAAPAPATKVAGITVNVTNTQTMDPNAMVAAILPALRRAAVRGLA